MGAGCLIDRHPGPCGFKKRQGLLRVCCRLGLGGAEGCAWQQQPFAQGQTQSREGPCAGGERACKSEEWRPAGPFSQHPLSQGRGVQVNSVRRHATRRAVRRQKYCWQRERERERESERSAAWKQTPCHEQNQPRPRPLCVSGQMTGEPASRRPVAIPACRMAGGWPQGDDGTMLGRGPARGCGRAAREAQEVGRSAGVQAGKAVCLLQRCLSDGRSIACRGKTARPPAQAQHAGGNSLKAAEMRNLAWPCPAAIDGL